MTRQVWKLAAIVALGGGALGGGLLLALPMTWPAASWPVAIAASHEARAVSAGRADPPDLAIARVETRRVLYQRPLDAGAWARLAWIADQDGDVPAMLEALDRSYIAAPYGPEITEWRLVFVFNRWDVLTPELRRQALSELRVTRTTRSRLVDRVRDQVGNPAGRLALALTITD